MSETTFDVDQTRSVDSDSATKQGELLNQSVLLEVMNATDSSMKEDTTLSEDSKSVQIKLSNLPEGLDYHERPTYEPEKSAQQSMLFLFLNQNILHISSHFIKK